jgi:hypothetical protein
MAARRPRALLSRAEQAADGGRRGPGWCLFDPGPPKALFATKTQWLEIQPTARTYAAARDGQRFLLANATQQAQIEPIRVVLNWDAGLRK